MSPIFVKLKDWRDARELTQAELAEKVGVRQATISDIENGKGSRIDRGLFDKLCRVLDVELSELLERTGDKKQKR